ncbi:MAG: hypothetical protein WDW38_001842 [Sanguina aurantia]
MPAARGNVAVTVDEVSEDGQDGVSCSDDEEGEDVPYNVGSPPPAAVHAVQQRLAEPACPSQRMGSSETHTLAGSDVSSSPPVAAKQAAAPNLLQRTTVPVRQPPNAGHEHMPGEGVESPGGGDEEDEQSDGMSGTPSDPLEQLKQQPLSRQQQQQQQQQQSPPQPSCRKSKAKVVKISLDEFLSATATSPSSTAHNAAAAAAAAPPPRVLVGGGPAGDRAASAGFTGHLYGSTSSRSDPEAAPKAPQAVANAPAVAAPAPQVQAAAQGPPAAAVASKLQATAKPFLDRAAAIPPKPPEHAGPAVSGGLAASASATTAPPARDHTSPGGSGSGAGPGIGAAGHPLASRAAPGDSEFDTAEGFAALMLLKTGSIQIPSRTRHLLLENVNIGKMLELRHNPHAEVRRAFTVFGRMVQLRIFSRRRPSLSGDAPPFVPHTPLPRSIPSAPSLCESTPMHSAHKQSSTEEAPLTQHRPPQTPQPLQPTPPPLSLPTRQPHTASHTPSVFLAPPTRTDAGSDTGDSVSALPETAETVTEEGQGSGSSGGGSGDAGAGARSSASSVSSASSFCSVPSVTGRRGCLSQGAVHISGCNTDLLENQYSSLESFLLPADPLYFNDPEDIATTEPSVLVLYNIDTLELVGGWEAVGNNGAEIEWARMPNQLSIPQESYTPVLASIMDLPPPIPVKLTGDKAVAVLQLSPAADEAAAAEGESPREVCEAAEEEAATADVDPEVVGSAVAASDLDPTADTAVAAASAPTGSDTHTAAAVVGGSATTGPSDSSGAFSASNAAAASAATAASIASITAAVVDSTARASLSPSTPTRTSLPPLASPTLTSPPAPLPSTDTPAPAASTSAANAGVPNASAAVAAAGRVVGLTEAAPPKLAAPLQAAQALL